MSVVEIVRHGPVATVTLNDVAQRNALGSEMMGALVDSFRSLDEDPTVRVVVVTNSGPVFCAGANLKEATSGRHSTATTRDLAELLSHVRHSPKPYVGRLAGHCVAGGVGLAAVMDVAIAVDVAHFGFSEVRLGVAPAVISVVCLEKMRAGDARELFLRGQRISATRAVEVGLISRTVTREELDNAVDEVVNDLLAGEPRALALAKRLTYDVPSMSESDAFRQTATWSAELFASPAAAEGVAAVLAKRPAPWVNTYRSTRPDSDESAR